LKLTTHYVFAFSAGPRHDQRAIVAHAFNSAHDLVLASLDGHNLSPKPEPIVNRSDPGMVFVSLEFQAQLTHVAKEPVQYLTAFNRRCGLRCNAGGKCKTFRCSRIEIDTDPDNQIESR
jgi:hypothetical protein